MTLKQVAKVLLAAVTTVTVAAPIPAAPPAGAAAGKAPVHHTATRFRGVPTFANSTLADIGTFDDPIVREAAVEGLGRYNGAVVAVNPNTGRVLTVVNQKVAVAALEENVITRDTMLRVHDRHARYMNLTEALAHSNNDFFEQLGVRMGFDTVSKYARLLGLGELAGYNLPEEHPGSFPMAPPAKGGVARMSSFGEDIQNFQPKVKRDLNIAPVLPEIREGMLAAVLYGTAKRSFDAGGDETPLGKTGTCNDPTSKVGWFVTYADEQHPKIALAVLLRGQSHQVEGPTAALVAGRIYKRLREQNYFASSTASNNTVKPVTIAGTEVASAAGN